MHKSKSTSVRLEVVMTEQLCGVAEQDIISADFMNTSEIEHRFRRVVEGEPLHIRYWPWQVR